MNILKNNLYKDTFIRTQNQSAYFYLSLLCVRLRYHFKLRSFEEQILMCRVWIPFGFVFWQFTMHQIDSCHIHSQPQVWCPGLFHLIIPGNITEQFNRIFQIRQVMLNARLMKLLWSLPPHTSFLLKNVWAWNNHKNLYSLSNHVKFLNYFCWVFSLCSPF